MSTFEQILLGSILLGTCSLVHIVILVYCISILKALGNRLTALPEFFRISAFFSVAFSAVILAHTIQVWLWAFTFVHLGTLPVLSDAMYFSLVSYTTLGYGDIVLERGFRILSGVTAVTGLLNFGFSTAFLVSLFTRMLQDKAEDVLD